LFDSPFFVLECSVVFAKEHCIPVNIFKKGIDTNVIPGVPASAPKKFNKSFQIPKYNPTQKSAKFTLRLRV